MGTKRTGKMPNRGKLLAPIEKAAYPCWASTVPDSEQKQTKNPNRSFGLNVPMADLVIKPKTVIRTFNMIFHNCLQSFVFYKVSFACF